LGREIRQFIYRTKSGRANRALFTILGDEVRVLHIRRPGQPLMSPEDLERSDLVDELRQFRRSEQLDLVLPEHPVDAGRSFLVAGAELPDDDELKRTQLRIRVVVQGSPLDGVLACRHDTLVRVRGFEAYGIDQVEPPILKPERDLFLFLENRHGHLDVAADLPLQASRLQFVPQDPAERPGRGMVGGFTNELSVQLVQCFLGIDHPH
jgi:hypothetical protein